MMITSLNNSRIWLCTTPTDMRRSYNGLSALVKNHVKQNPLNGDLFVFINRKRTQMKALYFEAGGYCLWGKRLEQGTFAALQGKDDSLLISWAQLRCLLEGMDIQVIKQRKRFLKAS